MTELTQRVLAGIVMIAVALGALWAGGIWFGLLASAAGLLMIGEWAGLLRADRWRTRVMLVLLALFLVQTLLIANGAAGQFGPGRVGIVPATIWPGGGVVTMAMVLVLLFALGALLTRRVGLAAGILYAGLPALALIYLREERGLLLTLWAMALVWATDIGAYFAGRGIGGPKLAPRISPNKTWAGLIGGVIAAELLSLVMAIFFGLSWIAVYFATTLAVAAQIGDLFESWLKRRVGAKDSGRLLPGHGGVMDRLDGLVPVAVIVAGLVIRGWL
ncbi:MAG: phosphatidate cytidylyltransferase [Sphingomonas sp.]|nr:phosphatidate cytidylyltransferase [Sphingomonas sp.]MDX3883241.1 phosphatidate cytidylyltransferase [Sphingomonas sp.]